MLHMSIKCFRNLPRESSKGHYDDLPEEETAVNNLLLEVGRKP